MKRVLIACCVVLLAAEEASAGMIFAASVHSFSGSSTGDDPTLSLGAPDLRIIQMVDGGGTLVLDFGMMLSAGTLSIFTYDDLFPASARVEVSADADIFTVVAPILWDTNGPIGPPFPHVDVAVGMPFRYVRFYSLESDPGFDIDAVGFSALPEPSTFSTCDLGAIATTAVGLRRRRRAAAR
ncbi:MAG: hypothetical protein SFX72_15890 [Isosphaeraceae bacterium]|nr:hypothetical protein [Isosphaeraceae bacterium]